MGRKKLHKSSQRRMRTKSETRQKKATLKPHGTPGALLATACVLLSVFAFSFNVTISNDMTSLVYDVNSMLQFAIAAASIYLFRRLFWANPFMPSMTEAVIAALFAIMSITGLLLDSMGTIDIGCMILNDTRITSALAVKAVLLLMTVGFFCFYYACIDWLFAQISKLDERNCTSSKPPSFFKHEITLPICMAVIAVAWLPYILYFFPFTVATDTSAHLAQLLGDIELTTHFPYLPGLIESKLYQFGTMLEPSGTLGMFLMGIIQVLLGLFVFAEIVTWIKRLKMPNWIVYASWAFFALFPLVPIYMVQIGKDTLHTELVALFALQILLFCMSKHKRSGSIAVDASIIYSPWAIAFVGLLVALTRNNGIISVVAALVICLVFYRDRWMAIASAALCVCFCVWQFLAIPAFGVKSAGYTEMCSMPAQVIAACLKDGVQLTEEEQAQLQEYFAIDLTDIASRYTRACSDPVKDQLSLQTADDAAKFTSIALSLAAKNPTCAISAALDTTYGMWYPFCRGTYHSEDTPYIIATTGDWMHMELWYASTDQQPALAESKHAGMQMLAAFHYIPVVSMFYTPGVYLWLMLLILGFSIKRRSGRALAATVLSIFIALWAALIFGPCASLRYALPAVFSLPILVSVVTAGLQYSKQQTTRAKGDLS